MIVGDKRKFLSCLVMIDEDNVMKFAQDNDVPLLQLCQPVPRRTGAAADPGRDRQGEQGIRPVEQVKAFPPDRSGAEPEDEELTPTMKLKRSFVSAKYKDLIDSMYEAA